MFILNQKIIIGGERWFTPMKDLKPVDGLKLLVASSDIGAHTHSVAIGSHGHTITVNAAGNAENTVKNIAFNYIVRLA
ncbi:hypothetical protein J4872_005009 [Escherichia coli]|nr:hypothetical protein [Escherichia coli]EHC1902024.1 hypothetical protein [Escherichia coli]EHH4339870.1 hypothetical protein [Escherichia coli]EIN4319031.1 hypothetical protein [Escherichia coli]EJA7569496.1 hypothetical protein [Escherichia coli]